MTAIGTLAQFIAQTPRGCHPESAIQRAKNAYLDTIGCIFLGAGSSSTRAALAAADNWGSGDAPVIGTDVRLPPPWAALANGASAHAFDLDDYTLQANDHASAVLVPSVLAATHRPGSSFSGQDILDSYLMGLEVIFRLGEAVNMEHYNLGWHTTSTLDSLGATAAVCRLWQLDENETAAALSLTTSLGSGYVSQFGTDAKPLHAGFSAKNGILAAGLARGGASAYGGALDGEVSFKTLLCPPDTTDFDTALGKLGAPWGIEEFGLGAKVYPSCGYTHRSVDAAIELHRKLGIESASEIESASASLPDFHLAILPFQVPKDRTEALFSTAYCVALGLTTGTNRIGDFFEETVQRADLQSLAARVAVSARTPVRPEINVDPDDPDEVAVILKDGRRETAKIGLWTGAPGRDLDNAGFESKFRECLELFDGPESNQNADRLLEAISHLDNADSLNNLYSALGDDIH